jgi:large-conductance mechanosensitive channel
MLDKVIKWVEKGQYQDLVIGVIIGGIFAVIISMTMREAHYKHVARYEMEEQLTQMWAGKSDSIQYGKMVIQRVKGNEIIIDRINPILAKGGK